MVQIQSDTIKNIALPLASTVIGSLIALGGVYIGIDQQKDIWNRQVHLEELVRITNKRTDLISDMAQALTNAQRAKLLNNKIDMYNERLKLEYNLCSEPNAKKNNEFVCGEISNNRLNLDDLYLQHAAMQSNYIKVTVLSEIYFCDETKAVLKSIEGASSVPWWDISLEKQGQLLRAMISEDEVWTKFRRDFGLDSSFNPPFLS